MRGGSLTRYHTPVLTKQEGKGLAEDLIKLAGPLIVQQAQAGLHDQGSRQFDQIFGQPFALLLGEHGRVVPR